MNAIKLRPYQEAALEGARVALRGGASSALLQLPTGVGKSILFQKIIEGVVSRGKRAMLLVQGQNLVRQAAKHLASCGVSVGVEMGDDRVGPRIGARGLIDDAPQIVVASRDSLARRLKHYPRDFFRMIVNDEAHHCLSDQNLQILEHFGIAVPRKEKGKIIPGSKTPWLGNTILIGLTATPDRGDHGNIMDVFEVKGFKYNILEAIEDGWLVPIRQELCHLEGLDLSKVRTSVGDLNASDLEAVIRPLLEPICREIVKVADGRPTLIYNPLVTMAEATTAHLTQKTKGAGRVVTVTAETEEREAMFKAMARGEIWGFSSVGTLTEGVDIPCATIGVMLRMTKSRPLYAQIMGRILRPAESLAHALNDMTKAERRAAIRASSKPEATMLDFAGNSGRHKLIGVVDVIGEDEDDKTMSLAKGHILRGVTNPHEAIEKARADLAEMVAKAAGGEIERILVDPFALFSVKAKADTQARPPTPAQVDALLNAGAVECKIHDEKSRDKARAVIRQRFDIITAAAMLDESRRRIDAREATLRQVRKLVKAGLPVERARTIDFREAGRALDDLQALDWKPNPGWIAKYREAPASAQETRT